MGGIGRLRGTYTIAIVVEESLELDNVGMAHDAHDLEFAVLARVSPGSVAAADTSHEHTP